MPAGDTLGTVVAFLFVFIAADWVSGSYLLVTAWQRRKRPRRRVGPSDATPLADEVEEWLRRG